MGNAILLVICAIFLPVNMFYLITGLQTDNDVWTICGFIGTIFGVIGVVGNASDL
jgi:hypothetical protein